MDTNNKKVSTKKSFQDKWENNPNLAFEETINESSTFFKWIINRNGFENSQQLKHFLKNKKRILDAGCGNGRIIALLRKYTEPSCELIGCDFVSSDVARVNLRDQLNTQIIQADLMGDLGILGNFDFIYCQEVLHHTSNPKKCFMNLNKILLNGGEIAIYVYKKKGPIREYIDDYIRNVLEPMPYSDSMKICDQITEFGKVLSEQNVKIRVPQLDILEIKEGEYDLQRFMYYFFMKCFWNPEISFHDNSVINYDWYHPQLCSRHTLDEIKSWFVDAGLELVHSYEDFYGITMRGIKPK